MHPNESTEVDRRTWLHVPSGIHWSTSSDTHQVVEIQIKTPKQYCLMEYASTPGMTSIVHYKLYQTFIYADQYSHKIKSTIYIINYITNYNNKIKITFGPPLLPSKHPHKTPPLTNLKGGGVRTPLKIRQRRGLVLIFY